MLLTVFSSCSKTNEEDLLNPPVEEETPICEPEGLYATEVKPIMDAHCITCHAPGGSKSFIPLDTYSDLKANSATLIASVNRDGSVPNMPAGGAAKLSDCDIQTIQAWVDGGMLDN